MQVIFIFLKKLNYFMHIDLSNAEVIDLFGGFHIGLKLALSFPLYAFFRLRSYGYVPSKSLQVVENSSIFPPICPRRTSLLVFNTFLKKYRFILLRYLPQYLNGFYICSNKNNDIGFEVC